MTPSLIFRLTLMLGAAIIAAGLAYAALALLLSFGPY